MEDSILKSTKKMLGLAADYIEFDLDVLTHINTVFSTLSQIGIGPLGGFMIEDDQATWTEYLGPEPELHNTVKSYIYLRVRLLFDPPETSFAIEAMNNQIREFEWRLNALREVTQWTEPPRKILPVLSDPDYELEVIDGGAQI